MMPSFKDRIRSSCRGYVADYQRFLKMRGYGDHVNDWYFVKRGFLTCWLEPGFHRFWQIWNPGIGYFAYKLYILLGGSQRRNLATVVAFVINGFIHNLVVSLLLWRWDFPLPFTFLAFGIFTIVSRWLDTFLDFQKLPALLFLVINIGLVIISFDFGFAADDLLKCTLQLP